VIFMLRALPGEAPAMTTGFEVGFTSTDGQQVRVGLADAALVRFELGTPVRSFPSYKRQRHFPGLWWSATTGAHVGYESWVERDELVALDFDPDVAGIASQPFWLFWTDENRSRSHAPDYFARRQDGSAVVVDCRPAERIKPRDAAVFETTRLACQQVGWQYRLVGTPDPVRAANLRWLAGYRHPRHCLDGVATALREVFSEPMALMTGAQAVGDPVAVLPVLFHLLWRHQLVTDLAVLLDAGPIVVTA
jgi:hypothetical protein